MTFFQFPPSRSFLSRLIRNGSLDAARAPDAMALLGIPPSSADWGRFLDRLLLLLGATCLGSGLLLLAASFDREALGRLFRLFLLTVPLLAVSLVLWRFSLSAWVRQALLLFAGLNLGAVLVFVASFDWEALGRLFRLFLLTVPLLAVLLVLWRFSLSAWVRQALLLFAGLNLGAVLVFAEHAFIRDLGSWLINSWALWALWAALLLPLAWFGRSKILWLTAWLLVQAALLRAGTWKDGGMIEAGVVFLAGDESVSGFGSFFIGNAVLWGLVARTPGRFRPPLAASGSALVCGLTATALVVADLLGGPVSPGPWLAWVFWLAAAYRAWRRTFFPGLVFGAFSVVVAVFAGTARLASSTASSKSGLFVFLGVFPLVLSGLAAAWLHSQRKKP